MSYDEFERSNYGGAPIYLYEFSLGGKKWRYAASQNPVTIGTDVYLSAAIEHEEYSQSGSPDTDELRIDMDAALEVAALYGGTPPSQPVLITLRTQHRGETEVPVVWSGLVKLGRRASQAQFSLTCSSLLATLARNGLRLFWGRGCPHALYDRNCRVDPADHETSTQITALSNTEVTCDAISELGDGYLAGGLVAFTHTNGSADVRAIENHTGNVITLLGLTDGMAVGATVLVYPGCAHTSAACLNKFDNLDNYGGFPHLPTKSPFDGDPVF